MPEISIKEALNKAYIKVKPERAAIEKFKDVDFYCGHVISF
jgi:hypothetical protein